MRYKIDLMYPYLIFEDEFGIYTKLEAEYQVLKFRKTWFMFNEPNHNKMLRAEKRVEDFAKDHPEMFL